MSKHRGAEISALARPHLIQFYFNPHSSNIQLSIFPITPAGCFTPLEDEAAEESHFIKIKKKKKNTIRPTRSQKTGIQAAA